MLLPSCCTDLPWVFWVEGVLLHQQLFWVRLSAATVEDRQVEVEGAMTITALDALSDVITHRNDVDLMPELRKGFHTLFTFKYKETDIYRTCMLPGPKPNTVFISLVLQILWSAFCQNVLFSGVRSHALAGFLTSYNRRFNRDGSMKLRLKLIPYDLHMYRDIKFHSGGGGSALKTTVLWNKHILAATFQFMFNWLFVKSSAFFP